MITVLLDHAINRNFLQAIVAFLWHGVGCALIGSLNAGGYPAIHRNHCEKKLGPTKNWAGVGMPILPFFLSNFIGHSMSIAVSLFLSYSNFFGKRGECRFFPFS